MAKKTLKKSFRGKVKKTAEKRESSKGGFSYLKLPNGISQYKPTPGKTEKFNIVPYIVKINNHPDLDKEEGMAIKGEPWFQLPFKVHSNIGAGDSSKAVVCPTTFGEKCPICEYAARRAKAGADWEEVKEYRPKDRVLYAIQEVETKSKNDTDYSVMDMSHYLFQQYLTDELAENEENECYADLEGGKTLKVRWKAEKFNNNTYAECGRIDFLDRDDLDEDVMEEAPCLDEILKVMEYEDLEKLFLQGEVDEEDEDEDEDDVPKKATPKRGAKKTSKPAPVEDEDEDSDDDDDDDSPFDTDEDGDVPPKKKTTSKKKPASKKSEPQITWEDLEEMDEDELIEVAEFYDVDVSECDDDATEMRNLIATEIDIEKPAPKKKTTSKKKPASKKSEEAEEEPSSKKKKPAPKKKEVSLTWDNVQDMELEELQELAEEHDIDIKGLDDDDDIRDAITDALDL